jgi:NAD(P)-dependent dehydrogenase (short-subunit alcohol dehydrogenase family)
METNYYGQLLPIIVLLPHFMAARKGHIVNVSSMMGYAAYAPTKFAIVWTTEALRHELMPYNIIFVCVVPA